MRQRWPDALSAVRWACEVSGNPQRPFTSRMIDTWRGEGDSTDAAGQAGIIFRLLWDLRGVPMSTLVARAVPVSTRCRCRSPCCSGDRLNADWKEAIDVLAAGALVGGIGGKSYDLRIAVLHRLYGRYASYRQIAAEIEADDATAARHGKEIEAWLGLRCERSTVETREIGIEPEAQTRATEILSSAGLLDERRAEDG